MHRSSMKVSHGAIWFHVWNCMESYIALDLGLREMMLSADDDASQIISF